MKAILARELKDYPDGTIWTTHGAPNHALLPIGGLRIKRAAEFSNQSAYRPNWFLAYSTITTTHVSKGNYCVRASAPEFDVTIGSGSTIFVWDEQDIRSLKDLLTSVLAVQSTGDDTHLVEQYNFVMHGLSLNLNSGKGEYLNRQFKLSPMQVKTIHALAVASTQTNAYVRPDELVSVVRPNAANPEAAIVQMINRTMAAIGHKIGEVNCPLLKNKQGHYYFIGSRIR